MYILAQIIYKKCVWSELILFCDQFSLHFIGWHSHLYSFALLYCIFSIKLTSTINIACLFFPVTHHVSIIINFCCCNKISFFETEVNVNASSLSEHIAVNSLLLHCCFHWIEPFFPSYCDKHSSHQMYFISSLILYFIFYVVYSFFGHQATFVKMYTIWFDFHVKHGLCLTNRDRN
jgi:hypothetical protein